MTIGHLLQTNQDIEASILLSFVLGQPKEFLYLHPEHELSKQELNKFFKLASRRRQGEPIAYLTGEKEFYGLGFTVNKHVLIPRPETEWLVEQTIRLAKKVTQPEILDIGTGSGAIAIALAVNLPGAKLTASDISLRALKIAKDNAQKHKAKIKFVHSDLLNNVTGKYDFMLANLPYVPIGNYRKLYKNLKYEPKLALTDNTNSARLYQKLFQQIPGKIKPGGKILMEIDPSYVELLQKFKAEFLPKFSIKFERDLSDLDRYAVLTAPQTPAKL